MKIKLFVDDRRNCPVGWHLARTNTDAIALLAQGFVAEISLDHDIILRYENGDIGISHIQEETFKPVAYYISLMKKKPKVRFHTGNFEAGRRMAQIIGVPFHHEIEGLR